MRVGGRNQVVDGGIINISLNSNAAVLTPVVRSHTNKIIANSDITGITKFDSAGIATTKDDSIMFYPKICGGPQFNTGVTGYRSENKIVTKDKLSNLNFGEKQLDFNPKRRLEFSGFFLKQSRISLQTNKLEMGKKFGTSCGKNCIIICY